MNQSLRRFTVLIVFAQVPLGPSEALGNAEPGAIAAAYLEALRKGSVAEAVQEFWDTDAMLTGAFGLLYVELSPKEQKRTQLAFANFVAANYSGAKMKQFLSGLRVRDSTTTVISESIAIVSLEVHVSNDQAFTKTLLVRRAGRWRIVDQGIESEPSVRVTLARLWADLSDGYSKPIRVVLEDAASRIRNE